jgi:hypothetical protein
MKWQYCVNMPKLYEKLGFFGRGRKLPKDFAGDFRNIVVPLSQWDTDGTERSLMMDVRVIKGLGRGIRRISVRCPKCKNFMSAGNLHQHIDTARCRTVAEAIPLS